MTLQVNITFIGSLTEKYGKDRLMLNINTTYRVIDIIDDLFKDSIQSENSLMKENKKNVHSEILILVNGKDITLLNGLNTKLTNGDQVTLLPISHGG